VGGREGSRGEGKGDGKKGEREERRFGGGGGEKGGGGGGEGGEWGGRELSVVRRMGVWGG